MCETRPIIEAQWPDESLRCVDHTDAEGYNDAKVLCHTKSAAVNLIGILHDPQAIIL